VRLVLSLWGKQVLRVSYIGKLFFFFLLFLGQVINTLQRQSPNTDYFSEELVTKPVFLTSNLNLVLQQNCLVMA